MITGDFALFGLGFALTKKESFCSYNLEISFIVRWHLVKILPMAMDGATTMEIGSWIDHNEGQCV